MFPKAYLRANTPLRNARGPIPSGSATTEAKKPTSKLTGPIDTASGPSGPGMAATSLRSPPPRRRSSHCHEATGASTS